MSWTWCSSAGSAGGGGRDGGQEAHLGGDPNWAAAVARVALRRRCPHEVDNQHPWYFKSGGGCLHRWAAAAAERARHAASALCSAQP